MMGRKGPLGNGKGSPLGTKMPRGKTLAEADASLGGDKGMQMLRSSPAFKKVNKKSSDRIGAGKLYRGMKSPV